MNIIAIEFYDSNIFRYLLDYDGSTEISGFNPEQLDPKNPHHGQTISGALPENPHKLL